MTILSVDARTVRGGWSKCEALTPCLLACLLLATGCEAVTSFGHFKFGSDGGTRSAPDAGSTLPDAGLDASVAADSGATCSAPSTSETNCSDNQDNDCDGLEDCNDPDCANDAHCCKPTEMPEVSCSGGVDNDCDGQIDCADSDCASSMDCCVASGAEVGNTACGDGVDNDCDGILDCKESACAAQAVCCVASGAENDQKSCSDGIDNDCDGRKDCADPDCAVVSRCCTATAASESGASCTNAKDDDCDGLADCRDPDCASVMECSACVPTGATETNCTDGKDNDCDKDRDCLDSDCANDPACCVKSGSENNATACVDGVDNDCNGMVDCADPGCKGTMDCCVATGAESTDVACVDGQDNDCDGLVDCQDPGCTGSQNCCVSSGPEAGITACSDGLDNDCNGKRDCADSSCQGVGSCCVSTGTEASQPNDGKDNDCDGLVDIPILNSAYPTQNLPAAGNEVALTFTPSIVANAVLECSIRRRSQLNVMPVFVTCPGSGASVNPHPNGGDASTDGAWVTDVRWRFPSGAHSQVYSFKYYIHHTLYKATKCTTPIKDTDWFAKAATRLGTPAPGLFSTTDTFLSNPFVRVTYQPPNANKISLDFQQDGSTQKVDMWSLRRRFVLSADSKFLLITRNYVSNRTSKCYAAFFQIHDAHHLNETARERFSCDAVVLNRQGAGVCLKNSGGAPDFARDSLDPYANQLGWAKANKFMWRQLVDERGKGEVHDYAHDESISYRNFTAKCSVQPCTNAQAIYLPDRALFP